MGNLAPTKLSHNIEIGRESGDVYVQEVAPICYFVHLPYVVSLDSCMEARVHNMSQQLEVAKSPARTAQLGFVRNG